LPRATPVEVETLVQKLAGLLHDAGWRSPHDAQWDNLREALPDLCDLLHPAAPAPPEAVAAEPDEPQGVIDWHDTVTGARGTLCMACGHETTDAPEPGSLPPPTDAQFNFALGLLASLRDEVTPAPGETAALCRAIDDFIQTGNVPNCEGQVHQRNDPWQSLKDPNAVHYCADCGHCFEGEEVIYVEGPQMNRLRCAKCSDKNRERERLLADDDYHGAYSTVAPQVSATQGMCICTDLCRGEAPGFRCRKYGQQKEVR
jgi:hypothetical protein